MMVTRPARQIEDESTSADEWPPHDLESLGACPLCDGSQRRVLFSGLRDLAFAAAPGQWTMWRCACGAAYLDPRPSLSSISAAYSRYYTHAPGREHGRRMEGNNVVRRTIADLKNDYLNRTFGYRLPAMPLGAALVRQTSRSRRALEHSIRHLPAPSSESMRLLDAGCGNGEFLEIATRLGFKSVGLDPDPKAIEAGRRAGLDIRPGILPGSSLEPGSFDHVTLKDVLEHLHEPVQALREVWSLLKPSGRIWISQSNLGAVGLAQFGPYWRGLEPPRHLTLTDVDGMCVLLQRCGFVDAQVLAPQPSAAFYFKQSLYQRHGLDPYGEEPLHEWNRAWEQRSRKAEADAARNYRIGESLTVVAYKPA
jgi:2-polyprenyl-3-methyl-5-hydroxy-6-metoxy-1,4-benzoquinol methylase